MVLNCKFVFKKLMLFCELASWPKCHRVRKVYFGYKKSQNGKKRHRKHQTRWEKDLKKSLWDVMSQFLWEKWTLNTWGWNVTMGKNVTQLGWPKRQWMDCSPVTFGPKKCSKQKIQGWTNNPSTMRSNVTVDVVKPRMLHWGGGFVGVETYKDIPSMDDSSRHRWSLETWD